MMCRERVDDPVSADLVRRRHIDLQTKVDPGRADDHRRLAEIFGGEHLKIMTRARNDGRNDDRIDRRSIKPGNLEQLDPPHRIFIARAPRNGSRSEEASGGKGCGSTCRYMW